MAQAEPALFETIPEEELFTKRPRISRRAVAEVAKAIDAATWDASTYDQTLRLGQHLPRGPLPRGPALGYCQDFVHIYPTRLRAASIRFPFRGLAPDEGSEHGMRCTHGPPFASCRVRS